MPEKISLDQICSERQFSVRSGPNGGDMLTKLSFRAPKSWDKERRSARFVMSKEIPDRYGDVVVAKGIKITDFVKNPVVLWAHNSRNAPIGMWSDVAPTGKSLEGVANFAQEGLSEEADQVARLVEASLLRACSIGFMPLEWEALNKEQPWAGYKFIESDLWECSVCSVPANPAALVKAAGGDTGAAMQAIELILDEWTRTPAGTIVPRMAFEKAYSVVKRTDAPTLVEVKAIDEDDEEVEEKTVADPVDTQSLVRTILDGISEAVTKAFGVKREHLGTDNVTVTIKGDEPAPVDQLIPTPEEIKAAAEQKEAEEAAAAEAEQKRLDEEKAAEEQAAAEQEELELKARALMVS